MQDLVNSITTQYIHPSSKNENDSAQNQRLVSTLLCVYWIHAFSLTSMYSQYYQEVVTHVPIIIHHAHVTKISERFFSMKWQCFVDDYDICQKLYSIPM